MCRENVIFECSVIKRHVLCGADSPRTIFIHRCEKSAIAASDRVGLADESLVPLTSLATRNVWLSDYFIRQLSARNS